MENLPIPSLSEIDTSRELLGLIGAGVAIIGINVLGWDSGYEADSLLEVGVGVLFAAVAVYLFARRVRSS